MRLQHMRDACVRRQKSSTNTVGTPPRPPLLRRDPRRLVRLPRALFARMASSPPAWLLAALAAPHAFALLPLLAPRQLAVAAARLGHTDAAVPYTAGSLVLGCGQAGALLQWLGESRVAGGSARVPLVVRAALATPLLLAGVALKLGAARALRPAGLYFGRQLGAQRDCALPLSTAWPYSASAHPDHAGSALLLLAGGALLLGGDGAPAGGGVVLLVWLGLYAASATFEEAFACAGQAQPVLKPGQNPFWNNQSRPEVRTRRATRVRAGAKRCGGGGREAELSAPRLCTEHCRACAPAAHGTRRAAALLHILGRSVRLWCVHGQGRAPGAARAAHPGSPHLQRSLFARVPSELGLFVTVISKLYKGSDKQRHALLVPITQVATRIVCWLCGYSVRSPHSARSLLHRV